MDTDRGLRAARRGVLRGLPVRAGARGADGERRPRAAELGLQPLRWPEPFPFDSALAMRVATYAKSIGRAVPFAQAAFRQAFAGGRALDDEDSVLIAAAACEMHPAAVLRGAALRSTAEQLARATAEAPRRGCATCPPWSRPAACSTASANWPRRPPHLVRRRGLPMRAKDAYRLIVTRGGRAPALLADPAARRPHRGRRDRQRRSGPVLGPPAARRLAPGPRAARGPQQLEAEEFLARWSTVES